MDRDKANTSTDSQVRLTKLDLLKLSENEPDSALVVLVEALQTVDIDAPLAKLNETTIADNNGGRIEL